MKKIIQKVIAREFLFLLGSMFLFPIIFFSWSNLSDSNQDIERKLENKIKSMTEIEFSEVPYTIRIFLAIDENQNNFHVKLKTNEFRKDIMEFVSEINKNPEKLNETYSYIYDNYHNTGFSHTKDSFIERIKNDKKSEEYIFQINKTEDELKEIRGSFFNNSINIKWIVLAIFLILFILRYIIHMTKWSVSQLKS